MCRSQERRHDERQPPPTISANFGLPSSLIRQVASTEAFVTSRKWKAGERGGFPELHGRVLLQIQQDLTILRGSPVADGWEWHPLFVLFLWAADSSTLSMHMFTGSCRTFWGLALATCHPWSFVPMPGGWKHVKLYTEGKKHQISEASSSQVYKEIEKSGKFRG